MKPENGQRYVDNVRRGKEQKTSIPISEADVTKQIRDYLRLRRIFHFKVWQGLGSHKGVFDICCVHHGKAIFIEAKKPGGKLSGYQMQFQAEVREAGGIAFMAESVDDLLMHFPGL